MKRQRLLVDVGKPECVHNTAIAKPCDFEFLLAMACGDLGADRGGVSMRAVYSPVKKNSSTTNSSNGASIGTGSSNGTRARTNGVHLRDIEPMVQERRVLKILQMIQSQPLQRIEDLAREFNLSHSRLEHLFKEETGVSLGQLLTEQRLERAAHLLLHTNMRIKEIAHTVGYEHPSSFIRAFERHFTQAPRLYRQKPAATGKDLPRNGA